MMAESIDAPEFLNATFYVEDITGLSAFYREFLALPVDFEEPQQGVVMGKVAVHDTSEGPAGICRLYFLVDDPRRWALRASQEGVAGFLREDGYGNPAWESTDPFGNSVVLLQRPPAQDG
jgi:hypothetical protein